MTEHQFALLVKRLCHWNRNYARSASEVTRLAEIPERDRPRWWAEDKARWTELCAYDLQKCYEAERDVMAAVRQYVKEEAAA